MKIYAPQYYKDFVCIADKCKHSCCVGWDIDIDNATLDKYADYKGRYSREIIESVDGNGEPHFRLDKNDRCPHLDEKGLCKIILNAGEDYLCHICREHPRFYNQTSLGLQVGIGMACEEACRIILQSDDYATFCEIGEEDGESCCCAFDSFAHIARIYEILMDFSVGHSDKLYRIGCDYNVDVKFYSDDEWRKLIGSLEFLHEPHKQIFAGCCVDATPQENLEKALERAFAYFVYRHCAEAWNEEEFCASLGFCLFCERLLASMWAADGNADVCELARILSEEIEYSEENVETIKNVFYIQQTTKGI